MGEYEVGKMPRPKRSNPKAMHNAGNLRKNLTPAERKLWSKIRDDQLGVNFRRHIAPAVGAGDTRLATTSPTSFESKRNLSSNWMALPLVATLGAGRV